MGTKAGHLSLKNKIFLANAAVAAAVLAFLWFVCTAVFYNTMVSRIEDDYRKMLDNMARNIETIARTAEDYARVISQSRGLQEEMREYLEVEDTDKRYYRARLWAGLAEAGSDIINPTTIASGMAVFIGDDVVYSGYDIPEESVRGIIRPEDLERARQRQKPVWNPLSLLTYSSPYNEKEYVFPVSKLIRDKNTGQALGVVTLFVGESFFSAAYEDKASLNNRSSYYLADNDGRIISASDKKTLNRGLCEVLGMTEEQYRICIEDGDLVDAAGRVPVLYSSMESRPGWRLFCVTELTDLAAEQGRMRFLLLMILAAALVMIMTVSWLVARTVTRPVYQLLNTMNEIEDNQTDARVPGNIGGEMGLLADEFNALMDSLEESRKAFCREQRLKQKNEYKLLQAQINPHFLYNTMETVSSFIKLGMSREALTALRSLVDFYRLSLSRGREIITVDEEIQLTESYLKLQGLRYVEYMDYRIEFDPETYPYRIPKLTIQPLVENAIYHGIKESRSRGLISIEGCIREQSLIITVCDTGKGIEPARLKEIQDSLESGKSTSGDSFGLGNIAQRLKLLYADQYRMQIESIPGRFTAVVIRIPLRDFEEDGV